MPLRCIDGETNIHAFDLEPERWKALAEENRQRRHLLMPCCQAAVTLRKSKLGTQFFAHKAIGECTTAPETEEHLKLKQLAVAVARAHGWDAHTEASNGAFWRADVLATKGEERVAIEIQWSQQTDEETMRRQERYAASGVRGLWLLRQRRFVCNETLPAGRVSADDSAFVAHLQSGHSEQSLSVSEFLSAAFTSRLHYGLPLNLSAKLRLNVGTLSCWACGADTDILSSIAIDYGPNEYRLRVAEFGDLPELFAIIRERLPADARVGIIRHRYSNTQGRAYLANNCAHCDALIGQMYEHEAWHTEREVAVFSVQVDERWHAMLAPHSREGWGVYQRWPEDS